MKLFKKRKKLNNKGLSLVELVCAVAIFGLATTAIGGAMVVSAQNYSRGTYELDVQQEAQTTTNLIGDLLYDATGASFNGTVSEPVLKIQGEGIEYEITFDKTNSVLNYKETVTGGATATGVLAENVKDFSANLDEAGNDFKTNKNVKIELMIEKNGRNYDAEYSTTARNGAAESVGVAETAEIIIESDIVLEPGQTYYLPYEVVGSITNKSISLSHDAGIDVNESGSNIEIIVASTAVGSSAFTVATIEQAKDADGNPTGVALASKTVTVKIRRVNGLTSPMDADDDEIADTNYLKSGTNYKTGAVYRIDFNFNVDNPNKVYGKAYDMDYVNPKQVDIALSMTGAAAGCDLNTYVDASTVQIVTTDTPYITFKLINDLPDGAEIIATATAKHPAGTNKTNIPYATVVDVVKINYKENLYNFSQLLRGTDGNQDGYGNKAGIWMTQEQLQAIRDEIHADESTKDYWNNFKHLLTIYELDAYGNKVAIPDFPTFVFGSGMEIQIDDEDSWRLVPDKKYIYRLELMFYKDAECTDPLWTVSPYSQELPLDAASLVYKYQVEDSKGTSGDPYSMTKGNMEYDFEVEVSGLEMSSKKDYVKFYVEKFDDVNGWQAVTSGYEIGAMNGIKNTGKVTMKVKFDNTGRYRLKGYLDNFPYSSYDGTQTLHFTGDLFDESDDTGIFYINVN